MHTPIAGNRRRHESWIDTFVESTNYLSSPKIFRQWSAITAVGAVMEQKVKVSNDLCANLYTFLIGAPGRGKSRAIEAVRKYLYKLEKFNLAPTSTTAASLIDVLTECKVSHSILTNGLKEDLKYNSMLISADELGVFLHEWQPELPAVLSAFYDVIPYSQARRGKDIRIKIEFPQLSLLCGATPSTLMGLLPAGAWDQGFMSRVLMIFSAEQRDDVDVLAIPKAQVLPTLLDDLKAINSIFGTYEVTNDFHTFINQWNREGRQPLPTHPKLLNYNSRRVMTLLKLCMISAIDRSNVLVLELRDIKRALGWLTEAEIYMPDVFKFADAGSDAKAMDEIYHFVMTQDMGKGVSEEPILRFASNKVPAQGLQSIFRTMVLAGRLKIIGYNPLTKTPIYQAVPE